MSDLREQLQAGLGQAFRLERELGGGGMSRVYLAEETRLGRRVVVKVLNPELAAGISAERFAREISLAAALQDPRIVPLLHADRAGDLPYYTMPYVEGQTLRARLALGPLPTDEALAMLRDVAFALEYAHARQIVHRDIKPENILLSGRTAVVTDFGIAKAISAATQAGSDQTLTGLGVVIGTPAYMAPEQAAGESVDLRADLYAWGVIAYELLAGEHPFPSRTTAQALLAAHITEQPVPLATRRRDLPPAITELVDQCLAKDPDRRPSDAGALVAALSPYGAATVSLGRGTRLTRRGIALAAGIVVLLVATGGWAYRGAERRQWAHHDAVSEAATLADSGQALAAVLTLDRAQQILPGDTAIAHALDERTRAVAITSSPPGAAVAIQDYLSPNGAWSTVGTTPLSRVRIPRGYLRWRVTAPGAGDYVAAPMVSDTMRFALDSARAAPAGMTWVPGGTWGDMISFVGWVGPYKLPPFYIDRFEVTNRDYQEFVAHGGYQSPAYWHEKFIDNGRELSWTEAMARFRDRTGRSGPSTWAGGHYPQGQADYPVSGISWYEALAYAAYAGKSLPTFAQWYEAAPSDAGRWIVPLSNIGNQPSAPTAAVGSFKGLGPYGTYDMAGNVREWTLNALAPDRRFIVGGAAGSQTYLYADPEALSPFDRSPENGVRCVRNLGPLPAAATQPIKPFERDFAAYRPVSDDVFRAYETMYAYPKTPLNATTDAVVADTPDWREERVSFDAGYGAGRVPAYLFLPKRVRAPYQTIVFFPSARVFDYPDSRVLGDTAFFDYVVQSGRAVLYPIYQDTYERRLRRALPGGSMPIDLTVQRAKDVGRAVDYLESRPDIDKSKLAYLGVSMGAAEGVVYATLQQARLKTVVLLDGGFFLDPPAVGGDQADFAPRLHIPVLMVNGRYDFTFSQEYSQDPLFRMLGTPPADKRHVVLETPHDVRADRTDLVREVLSWLDKYLGHVD